MTIRYLAKHDCATSAAKRASKPGVAEPAQTLQTSTGPAKLQSSKAICKQPKKVNESAPKGPKRDVKSSQLSLKAKNKKSATASHVTARASESSKRINKKPANRAVAIQNPEKCFVKSPKGQQPRPARVAALSGLASHPENLSPQVPTVKEVCHTGKSVATGG